MSNKNPKNQIKTSEQAKELGRKGGLAKRGSISIVSTMKRLIREGKIDLDDYTISLFKNAQKGNGAIAKLLSEYIDGKVTDKTEISGPDGAPIDNKITIEFVKPKK